MVQLARPVIRRVFRRVRVEPATYDREIMAGDPEMRMKLHLHRPPLPEVHQTQFDKTDTCRPTRAKVLSLSTDYTNHSKTSSKPGRIKSRASGKACSSRVRN